MTRSAELPALRPSTLRPVSAPAPVSSGYLGLLLSVLMPLGTVAAVVGFWPMWRTEVVLAAINTLLCLSIFLVGVVLLAEPGQAQPGWAMIISSALLIVSWSNEWQASPLPFVSQVVGLLWVFAGGWALYRYPDHRLTRRERQVFWVMLAWFVLTPLLVCVVSRASWHGFAGQQWWPALWPDRRAFGLAEDVVNLGTLAFTALFVGRWVQRLRMARPAERKLKNPPSIAAIIAGAVGLSLPVSGLLDAPDPVHVALLVLTGLGVLAVPLAFLISVLRRQTARSALAGLVPTLYAESSIGGIEQALRDALGDPTLALAVWSAPEGGYRDARYQPVAVSRAGAADPPTGRFSTVVTAPDGGTLALIDADSALQSDPELLEAAAAAVALTLQNAVLLDTVQAQYAELRAASARVVKSADAERRRLEQRLHDGAQQHFLALGLMIGATEAHTADPATLTALAEMRAQLEHALAELRLLARGLHPRLLSLGLAGAIVETLRRYPVPISVDLPVARLPEAAETTAYYAICEAVSNSVRHAQASRIAVTGRLEHDHLLVAVDDDGCGGARLGSGRGLDDLRDRVTALGGWLSVRSESGRGTQLELGVPCN